MKGLIITSLLLLFFISIYSKDYNQVKREILVKITESNLKEARSIVFESLKDSAFISQKWELRYYGAYILRQFGELNEAATMLEENLKSNGDSKSIEMLAEIMLERGLYSKSANLYEKLIAKGDSLSVKSAIKYADALYSSGYPEKAVEVVKTECKKSPSNFLLNKLTGDYYWAASEADSSLKYYLKAEKIDKKNTFVKLNISFIHSKLDNFSDAYIYASRAYYGDSTNLKALQQYASCSYKLEQFKEAKRLYEKLLFAGDSSSRTKLLIGISSYMIEDYTRGEEILRNLIDEDEDADSKAYFYLGSCCFFNNKEQEALKYFDEAIAKLAPDPEVIAMIMNQKGMVNLKLKKWEEAYTFLNEAYKINGSNAKLIYYMGIAKCQMKERTNREEGIKLLDRFIELCRDGEGNIKQPYRKIVEDALIIRDKTREELFMTDKYLPESSK